MRAQTDCDSIVSHIAAVLSSGQMDFDLLGIRVDREQTEKRSLTEVYTEPNSTNDGSSLYKGKNTTPELKRGVIARLRLEMKMDSSSWKIHPMQTALPPLTIDPKTQTAWIDGKKLTLQSCFQIVDSDNILKSPWQGMLWKHKEQDSTGIRNYKLVLGRLADSKRLYIDLKGHYVDFKGEFQPYSYRVVSPSD